LLVVASLLDRWAWEHVRYEQVYDKDWGRLLRVMGFLPTWMAGSAAIILYDRGVIRRGLLLSLAPLLAGIAGEVLKLLIRRERPGLHDGAYVFRDFADQTLSTRALGLPSTHAIVAFAGATMASYLFPRTWPVWWLLACGTALTRVAAGAHFLSDVALAGVTGWLVARALWRRARRLGIAVEALP
jgi:membrane-associated phospholipid phosphatase